MSKGLIGRKVGMTQIFDEVGNRIAVTAVKVEGNVVVQKKSAKGKDGYSAVKVGFGDVKLLEKEGTEAKWRLSKPRVGVFLKAGIDKPRRFVREFRVAEGSLDSYEVGQELGADTFDLGAFIDVTGTSKGRGFTGVMKRHNFAGTKASHGVHEFFRHGGSIGMSAYPGRVFKGKKMAGQYGNTRVTVQNLRVVQIMAEENVILIKGAVPGPNGGIVTLRSAVKKTVV
ncbi:50S ribosomal protein L3 [Lujinxingia litoralis]|uniref:Large ribosomal subunit protein uL3 n=1 Tax=Lujinxingia litoralis TaxID=2211119 RepID=A0A328C9Z1_9DELT|nr:50S ribosomal protein L3 [Lujinxingia litoralis]RAL23804.1 50S ribosomal protein L3 [Lujinxingia litoralis]